MYKNIIKILKKSANYQKKKKKNSNLDKSGG